MIQLSSSTMTKTADLKECVEAREFATLEFNRVKRAKLENERAKSIKLPGCKDDKQLDRERCNRASAAASRAKIVYYSKELEKRTDRLEMERNREMKRADRAIKKVRALQEEVRNLKKALRDIWEMKDQRTCSYLMDSEALFLLSPRQEDSDLSTGGSDSDIMSNGKNEMANDDLFKSQGLLSPESRQHYKQSDEADPKMSKTQLSTPFRTTSTIRNLVNPTSVEPAVQAFSFSQCASTMQKKFHCSLPLASVTLQNDHDLTAPRIQRTAMH